MNFASEIFTHVASFDKICVLLNSCYTAEFDPSVGQAAVAALGRESLLKNGETTVVIFSSLQSGKRIWAVYNGWITTDAPRIIPSADEMARMAKEWLTMKRRRDVPLLAVWVTPIRGSRAFETKFTHTLQPGHPLDAEYMTLRDSALPTKEDSIGFDEFILVDKPGGAAGMLVQ